MTPWRRADGSRRSWNRFLRFLESLPDGSPFRHNVAGDLPGRGDGIDFPRLEELRAATARLRAWTYSHKRTPEAIIAIRRINRGPGLAINLSGNSPADADRLADRNAGPVVTVLPSDWGTRNGKTPAGRMIVTCPATYREDVTCASCGNGSPLCARKDRGFVIGFPAHGIRTGAADAVAREV